MPEATASRASGVVLTRRFGARLSGVDSLRRPYFMALVAASAIATVTSVVAGMPVFPWALAAASVALLGAAIVAERRLWPVHEMSAWLIGESDKYWLRATGTHRPLSPAQAARWLRSPAGVAAPPLPRAAALLDSGRFTEARALMSTIPEDASIEDLVEREAFRAQADYLEQGTVDFARWRQSLGRLAPGEARCHHVSVALIEAAKAFGEGREWYTDALAAYRQHGPFTVPPRFRWMVWLHRLGFPAMALGLVAIVMLVFQLLPVR